MTTKARQQQSEEARERLLEWLQPGQTVYTILRRRSASGMSRLIDVLSIEPSRSNSREAQIGWLSYNVARALGWTLTDDGIRVSGAGMDMGFHLVYSLGRVLFPDGFDCTGESCPSNEHSNGDRDYTPGHVQHSDGGYALRQRWL